jgi:hypothetical protein
MLALFSLVAMLHPDDRWSMATAAVVLPAILIGIWRHQHIASPKTAGTASPIGDEPVPTQAATANLASEG